MRRRRHPSAALLVVPLLVTVFAAAPATAGSAEAPVITSSREPLATAGCHAPYRLDPVVGCVRDLEHGMLEYVTPDGARGTTKGHADHGADDGAAGDHPVTAAAAPSRSLPSTRRAPVCAPDGSPRIVVLYGHRPGADRRSDHLDTIRATVERSNQLVALSAQRSGGPVADLRVRCDADGTVAVGSVLLGSNRFADLRVSVAAAGHLRPNEKYLLFADLASPDAGVAGTADMFLDDRRTVDNRNNGRSPMYAVVYGARNFTGSVALHEVAHSMGAVQPGAPAADGYGHCTDDSDVVCAPGGSARCAALTFDCGNDTYFSTATRPGEWLDGHWNLGWEGNRFISLGAGSVASSALGPGGFTDTAGHTHGEAIATAVVRRIAAGYPDGTFRPERPVTRGQMATFLTRALGLTGGDPSGFLDVSGHVHAGPIGAIVRAGVTLGYPDHTFRPDGEVTRGQLAAFLTRALALPRGDAGGFTDVRGSVHEAAIASVAAAGITHGYRDGTFRPDQPVPRGQMAAFLVRALDRD